MPLPRAQKTAAKRPARKTKVPVELAHIDAHAAIEWDEKELAHLARLAESEPAKPTEALIRAMKS